MKQLPIREKELIYYRYYLDLTIREIAGKTGSSKSQVQRDLDEAEKKLKIFLLSGTKGRIETL
ncbi:MAG: sigma factor-like helix-turn-helix DNA-binding protein [Eubacteriales bacterium]